MYLTNDNCDTMQVIGNKDVLVIAEKKESF